VRPQEYSTMTATPEQLFAQFRAHGDPAALGALFDRTSPQLLSLALHLCGNPADAEDALQATFVTAIARAATWDASRPVQPWLGGILTLQCKKVGERRARRREAALPEPELLLDDGSPVDANERRELVGKLREHIDRLPPEQRQVLLLQLEHGLSPAEVGEVLGVPPGTVRMRLHRAVKALRGVMPAGLVAMMLAALPTRGVAAVRAVVVQQAGLVGTITIGGGMLLMKKVLALVGVVVLIALGWAVSLPFRGDEALPALQAAVPEVAGLGGADQRSASAAPLPVATQRSAVAVATAPPAESTLGALRLVARFTDTAGPIPNVPVRLWPDHAAVEERFERVLAATGDDGTRTVGGLAPGRWRVAVWAGQQVTAEVRAGETTEVDLPFRMRAVALRWARGCVRTADGQPARGATLVAGVQGSRCAVAIGIADAAGRFAVPISSSMLLVGARLAGHAPSSLQPIAGRDDVEFVLGGPGATVAGLVVDAEGAPVRSAVVEVGEPQRRTQWTDTAGLPHEFPPAQRLATDAAGRFLATDLPAGMLGVYVRADGCAPFHCFVEGLAGGAVELRCELLRGVALVGKVVDEAGLPVAGAQVGLGGTNGEARQTDAEGRFGYRYVAVGPQWIEVTGEHIATTRSERAADATGEWCVVVRRWPLYLLRLVDENGGPLAQWVVRPKGKPVAATDAEGRVSLHVADDAGKALLVGPPGSIDGLMPLPWPDGLVPGVETNVVLGADRRPAGVLTGQVLGPDGTPLPNGQVELCGIAGDYLFRQPLTGSRFTFERVPPGEWVVVVHRAGRGSVGGSFPVAAMAQGEVRDLGLLRLPREGSLAIRIVLADGTVPRDASTFLFDTEGREHFAPPRDGQDHPWPAGRYTWKVLADEALWQAGSVEVRAGEPTNLDVVLRPAVRRYVEFPVPLPAWGEPKRVGFVLRAPDGSVYDQGDFDPREELPYRYMPPLCLGTWRLELTTDDGRRFSGAFELSSMAPSREPIRIAVQPAR